MENGRQIDPGVARIMSSYLTCEAATVSRSGTPIAWPVTGVWRPGDQVFALSTSIGFPRKAHNVRRDPHVALLFSDPTGSGLDQAGQVLVQGEAECPDEIVTRFSRNADVWERLVRVQPSSRALSAGRLARHFMDVYYMRLFITVTPTAVTTRPPSAGVDRKLQVPAMPGLPETAARELSDFPGGVLAGLDAAGHPTLARVVPEPADGGLLLPGADARPGRASLLFHRHDEVLDGQRSLVVVGELAESDKGFVLRPDRVVDGVRSTGPRALFRLVRGLRTRGQAYLDERGLDRPEIPWHELEAIHATVDAGAAPR